MEKMVFAAAVVLVVEVIAFAVGFVWAFVWHVFLKPTGRKRQFLDNTKL